MGRTRRRGRGEGEVERLPSGSYRARVTTGTDPATGKRLRESATFPTKQEALEWRAARLLAGASSAGTVGDWLTRWLALHRGTVSAGTYRTDRQTAERHLRPALGSLRLRGLTPLAVESWLAGLAAAGVSQGERHKAGKTLRNALNAAVRAELLPRNPMERRVRVPAAPRPKTRSLTPDELARVLAAADGAGRGAMFRVWVELGLRPGELIGLRWEDYDGESVAVERTVEYTTGKVRPPKTPRVAPLPLSPATRAMLDAIRRPAGVMFGTKTGKHYWPANFLDGVFRPVMRAARVRGNRYVLRHTCASVLLSNGVNILIVSQRLGHSSPAFTLRVYGHLMPHDQHRAAETWGSLLPGRTPHDPPRAAT